MAPRIDVDPLLAPVRVPAEILHELCQHALETAPEECCGLIVGNSLERYRRLVRCQNVMAAKHEEDPREYPRGPDTAYFMSPHDYQMAQHDADEAGEVITAVYHSHVGADLYFSEMDLAYAQQPGFPFPKADQIVVGVIEHQVPRVAVFRRDGSAFAGHRAEPASA